MAFQRIPAAQATEAQLIECLTVVHGVEIPPKTNRARLLLELNKVSPDGTVLVSEAVAAAPPSSVTAPTVASVADFLAHAARNDLSDDERAKRDATKITVIVDKSDEAGGDQPVPVCVNGRNMFVPRGEPVAIRYPYYVALVNAKRLVVEQTRDNQTFERTVQAYPFQTVGVAA